MWHSIIYVTSINSNPVVLKCDHSEEIWCQQCQFLSNFQIFIYTLQHSDTMLSGDQPWMGGPSVKLWQTKCASRYFSVFGHGSSSNSSRLALSEHKFLSSHLSMEEVEVRSQQAKQVTTKHHKDIFLRITHQFNFFHK